jgi:hypothetical protein
VYVLRERTSPSASVSLAIGFIVKIHSSEPMSLSSTTTGISFTELIVIVTVTVADANSPSYTWNVKLSVP